MNGQRNMLSANNMPQCAGNTVGLYQQQQQQQERPGQCQSNTGDPNGPNNYLLPQQNLQLPHCPMGSAGSLPNLANLRAPLGPAQSLPPALSVLPSNSSQALSTIQSQSASIATMQEIQPPGQGVQSVPGQGGQHSQHISIPMRRNVPTCPQPISIISQSVTGSIPVPVGIYL